MGYVRTVVRRHVAARIEEATLARRHSVELDSAAGVHDRQPDPEQESIDRQRQEIARRVLNGIPRRDREVLIRFYLNEQLPGQICREMGLTDTQFRLLKSRAKARFGELGRQHLSARRLFRF